MAELEGGAKVGVRGAETGARAKVWHIHQGVQIDLAAGKATEPKAELVVPSGFGPGLTADL